MEYTQTEFVDLSNRSEKAFWFMVNGPVHWSKPGWNVGRVAGNMKAYQRALTRYAKANNGQGVPDQAQLRAMEHVSYMDRILNRIFAVTVCKRQVLGTQGDKAWLCQVHGLQKGDARPCTKAYMDWLLGASF